MIGSTRRSVHDDYELGLAAGQAGAERGPGISLSHQIGWLCGRIDYLKGRVRAAEKVAQERIIAVISALRDEHDVYLKSERDRLEKHVALWHARAQKAEQALRNLGVDPEDENDW